MPISLITVTKKNYSFEGFINFQQVKNYWLAFLDNLSSTKEKKSSLKEKRKVKWLGNFSLTKPITFSLRQRNLLFFYT